jgi:hypothetical protein
MSEGNGQEPSTDDPDLQVDTDPEGPVTLEKLSTQMRGVIRNQATLIRMMRDLTLHVTKLQHTKDPLTWQRRGLVMFAGAFAGGGIIMLLLRAGAALAAGH